jgi:hypothetical protein
MTNGTPALGTPDHAVLNGTSNGTASNGVHRAHAELRMELSAPKKRRWRIFGRAG